jgi:hypothetical protein
MFCATERKYDAIFSEYYKELLIKERSNLPFDEKQPIPASLSPEILAPLFKGVLYCDMTIVGPFLEE